MKQNKLRALLVGICCLLVLGGTVSGTLAKYVRESTLSGTVSITAELGVIELLEHRAVKQADGSYTLHESDTTMRNVYDAVIPGMDIPKDPWVRIKDKSSISAYVYLKIESDTLPDTMTYALKDHWLPVDGQTHVYVYAVDGVPAKVSANITIPVLENDCIEVGQKLQGTLNTTVELSFSASMKQCVGDKTAAQIYADNTNY